MTRWFSSYKGRAMDALGQRAEEGRGKQRNATGSRTQTMIRRYPNGVTRWFTNHHSCVNT
jgi:hypothetical protein